MGRSRDEEIQPIVSASNFLIDIREQFDGLKPFPLLEKCCIYKVPDSLRKSKEEAYIPQVISIGPFHHGDTKLQMMEEYKIRYVIEFMDHLNINFEELMRSIEKSEEKVRLCYANTISLSRYDFMKMILVDAIFIIELFVRSNKQAWTSNDKMVLKPWLATRMQQDLLLLENQLPFFIIKELYKFASVSEFEPSFTELTFEYFHPHNLQDLPSKPEQKIKHFVDLLRKFYLPENPPARIDRMVKQMHSVSQLAKVGLKLKANHSTKCLLDLEYNKGVLEIPCFTLDNSTELNARNLIALEQCHYPTEAYVMDYFIMLDLLIKSEKDVDLFARRGIIANGLGNNDATIINNLGTVTLYSNINSKYQDICEKLVEFYKKPRNRWLASLKWDYLRNPWVALSTTAGIVLLLLTIIQTICSIMSLV